jgi:RNA polymerase sigma factor (sigma-70 family)
LDPNTFKQLQGADWETIGKELVAYAEHLAQNYRWRRGGSCELAQGKTSEDIVQEVIVKTIEGDRRWKPERGPLKPWLKAQVRSVMSNLVRSAAHKHEREFPNEDHETTHTYDEYYVSEISTSTIPAHLMNPEDIVLEHEEHGQADQKISALFQSISGETDLEDVVCAVMGGCKLQPRYLAEYLGVSVSEINNRLKKLRRRAKEGGPQCQGKK